MQWERGGEGQLSDLSRAGEFEFGVRNGEVGAEKQAPNAGGVCTDTCMIDPGAADSSVWQLPVLYR